MNVVLTKEHERSINQRNLTTALSEHAHKVHNNRPFQITDFDLEILRRCRAPVEARLAEARAISNQNPQLNRRHKKECLQRAILLLPRKLLTKRETRESLGDRFTISKHIKVFQNATKIFSKGV